MRRVTNAIPARPGPRATEARYPSTIVTLSPEIRVTVRGPDPVAARGATVDAPLAGGAANAQTAIAASTTPAAPRRRTVAIHPAAIRTVAIHPAAIRPVEVIRLIDVIASSPLSSHRLSW